MELKDLIGKTIKNITQPDILEINESERYDDNIVIAFTDGTTLKLGSWDAEGYNSGISKEIIKN